MGMYSEKLAKSREGRPATQIREEKCTRSKERSVQRKKDKGPIIKERLDYWRSLSPIDQLKELDKRPGKSTKQRIRILREVSKSDLD